MIRAIIRVLCAIIALCLAPVHAATLTVRVVDAAGHPVANAVVSLRPDSGKMPAARIAGNYRIVQRDKQFQPAVLVVPPGASVAFPNLDPFRHHVYSFSAAKRFELKLFAHDQTRSVVFDRPGVVSIGCNIHDQMAAWIIVSPNGWTAVTGADGIARIADAPAGGFALDVWHPWLRAPGNTLSRHAAGLGSDRAEPVRVDLRMPPMPSMDGY